MYYLDEQGVPHKVQQNATSQNQDQQKQQDQPQSCNCSCDQPSYVIKKEYDVDVYPVEVIENNSNALYSGLMIFGQILFVLFLIFLIYLIFRKKKTPLAATADLVGPSD